MPAGLPGSTPAANGTAGQNPSAGLPVIFDLISGPRGSPKDNDKDYATGTGVANANASTGGLSTGIGFGLNLGPQGVKDVMLPVPGNVTQNFTDNYVPGISKPDATASANSTYMYIGGGKSSATLNGEAANVPYTAGFGIGAAGNGGSRDAGAGPAFTGFTMKMVTAAADVAAAAAVETNYANRSGAVLPSGNSTFGSFATATAAPSMTKAEEEEAERVEREAKKPKAEAKPAPKDEKDPEKLKLAKDLDEAAKKEDERIKEEERVKREEGAKLSSTGAHVHTKETPDGLDNKPKAVPPKKDK